MALRAVLFDLDGTLLPMDMDGFLHAYLSRLVGALAAHGYEPKALSRAILGGTDAMLLNDGRMTNEEIFFTTASALYGQDLRRDTALFDEFYKTEFPRVQTACGYQPKAAELLRFLHERGMRTVLATSPLFPRMATEERMRWAGVSPADFELYTTYEDARHAKPNPAYYEDVLQACGLLAEECLMVGNDVSDDMIAATLGMRVFLLTDCLINKDGSDIDRYPHGDFDALMAYIRAQLSEQ